MKICILTCASKSETWSKEAKDLYLTKLKPFGKIEWIDADSKKISRKDQGEKRIVDSEAILKHLTADDFVILFDEKGKSFTSLEFAKKFESILNLGKKRVCFVIGGPFGISEDLKKRGHLLVSLSAMTMNHLVAEVVVLEQLYRTLCILKNLPYHNEG